MVYVTSRDTTVNTKLLHQPVHSVRHGLFLMESKPKKVSVSREIPRTQDQGTYVLQHSTDTQTSIVEFLAV